MFIGKFSQSQGQSSGRQDHVGQKTSEVLVALRLRCIKKKRILRLKLMAMCGKQPTLGALANDRFAGVECPFQRFNVLKLVD